jgi:rhombotail lipoprotein
VARRAPEEEIVHTNRIAPAGFLLALVGCSSTIDRGRMHEDLQHGDLEFSSRTVKEIEAIRPQIQVPFRLAVAPPVWRREATWSREELAEIESWGPELSKLGLVTELVVIPEATYAMNAGSTSEGWLERLRVAAARHHADAVLVIRDVEDTSSWMNVLSILDLTIVGAWIFPGHQAESVSMMEGLVIDNRNEYLYCSGHGEGSAKVTQPLAYMEVGDLRREARVSALKQLKGTMIEKARSLLAGGT